MKGTLKVDLMVAMKVELWVDETAVLRAVSSVEWSVKMMADSSDEMMAETTVVETVAPLADVMAVQWVETMVASLAGKSVVEMVETSARKSVGWKAWR